MADTLKDVLERRRRILDNPETAADTAPRGAPTGNKKKPKKKKPAAERRGTGQTSFNLDNAIAKIRGQIERTSDPAKKAELEQRIKRLRENQ